MEGQRCPSRRTSKGSNGHKLQGLQEIGAEIVVNFSQVRRSDAASQTVASSATSAIPRSSLRSNTSSIRNHRPATDTIPGLRLQATRGRGASKRFITATPVVPPLCPPTKPRSFFTKTAILASKYSLISKNHLVTICLSMKISRYFACL